MLDYSLTINNVDFTKYVRYDSYETKKIPVFSEEVVTMDGVKHVSVIRYRGQVTFTLNPQNSTNTGTLVAVLLSHPLSVRYYNLQTQMYEDATMMLDEVSAEYLVKCKFQGQNWSQTDVITLEEL